MDLFSKITIAHFIWYLVPGLALVFFVLFPFVIIDPHLAKLLLQNIGSVGVVLLSIVMGFSLDGLRLYRFRTNYGNIKSNFFEELKNIIGIDLDPYFIQSHISEIARAKEVTGIGIHHAIWIMHGHLAVLSLLESIFWLVASVYFYIWGKPICPLLVFPVTKIVCLWTYATFFLFFGLVGYRFQAISIEDQQTTNRMFLNFAKQHKSEILQLLNVSKSNGV